MQDAGRGVQPGPVRRVEVLGVQAVHHDDVLPGLQRRLVAQGGVGQPVVARGHPPPRHARDEDDDAQRGDGPREPPRAAGLRGGARTARAARGRWCVGVLIATIIPRRAGRSEVAEETVPSGSREPSATAAAAAEPRTSLSAEVGTHAAAVLTPDPADVSVGGRPSCRRTRWCRQRLEEGGDQPDLQPVLADDRVRRADGLGQSDEDALQPGGVGAEHLARSSRG